MSMPEKKVVVIVVLVFVLVVAALNIFSNRLRTSQPPTAPISTTTTSMTIPPATSTAGVKMYRNAEFNFEFQYPDTWTFTPNTFGGPNTKFNLVGASPEEGGHPNPIDSSILINIVAPDFANNAAAEMLDLNAVTSTVMVSGMKETKYTYPFEGESQIGVIVPIGQTTTIILGARKYYEDVFNQVVASFTFSR